MNRLQNTIISLVAFFQVAALGGRVLAEECPQFIDIKDTVKHLLDVDPDTINPKYASFLTEENRNSIVRNLEKRFAKENENVKGAFERLYDYAVDLVEARMKGGKGLEKAKAGYGKQVDRIMQKYPSYESVLEHVHDNESVTLQEVNSLIEAITAVRLEKVTAPFKNVPEGASPVCISIPAPK